jgi:hypothetical protein
MYAEEIVAPSLWMLDQNYWTIENVGKGLTPEVVTMHDTIRGDEKQTWI